MILRCTQKLLKASGIEPKDVETPPEGLLGEWYANTVALPVRGKSVVMFTSASTMLTVVAPGKVLRSTLPVFRQRLPALLERIFMPPEWIAREMESLGEARVAITADRQVVGNMTDIASYIQSAVESSIDDEEELSWDAVELGLAGFRLRSQKYETPEFRLRRLAGIDIFGG